jgi:hypothetical protein
MVGLIAAAAGGTLDPLDHFVAALGPGVGDAQSQERLDPATRSARSAAAAETKPLASWEVPSVEPAAAVSVPSMSCWRGSTDQYVADLARTR